ncbi:MAG TPA: hypothetical protein VNO52_08115 [Methylomirabilota bacterium]|nr:hypothetical protein [Methylomirabilota bacterium]
MKLIRRSSGWRAMALVAVAALAADAAWAAETVYQNDFEKAELDQVPADFLVLEGGFAVKAAEGNKFLELPGAPLDTFGVLFGPTEKSGLCVSARIHGTARGRRAPAFGVGLNGVGGYRLQVSAQKKQLEIVKDGEVSASVSYAWESDAWTTLKLQIRAEGDGFVVEGKAWKQGAPEPAGWLIKQKVAGELVPGRASVWGNPFAGTPIRFDDLAITRASAGP